VQHAVDLDLGDGAPGIEDSMTRRSALPSVWPKPRSSGSMVILRATWPPTLHVDTRGFRNSVAVPASQMLLLELGIYFEYKLDDQLLVDVGWQVVALRRALNTPSILSRRPRPSPGLPTCSATASS
jgi:hypothetical protein